MTPAHRQDLRKALAIVWAVLSVGALVVLALPFVVDAPVLGSVIPACESKVRYGHPCPACGLTTGFYALSAGDVAGAAAANPAAPLLYGLFVGNVLTFLVATPRLLRSILCK
jgi:hypothetical protein